MEREEKSNEKRSEGLYFAPGTKERNKGRETRETEKEREYSNKWVWHRKCVWERERGGWVRTNFPWLVEPCYTVHPHPRWWKHMAPCERVWEKKVWRLTVSVWSHKRGAWQKCVCARVCTCDTNAATKRVSWGGRKCDSRAAVFDFRCHFGRNVDVNKHAAEKESKAADGQN